MVAAAKRPWLTARQPGRPTERRPGFGRLVCRRRIAARVRGADLGVSEARLPALVTGSEKPVEQARPAARARRRHPRPVRDCRRPDAPSLRLICRPGPAPATRGRPGLCFLRRPQTLSVRGWQRRTRRVAAAGRGMRPCPTRHVTRSPVHGPRKARVAE